MAPPDISANMECARQIQTVCSIISSLKIFLPFHRMEGGKICLIFSATVANSKAYRLVPLSIPVTFRWTIPLKGQLHEIFYLQFVFRESNGFHGKNIPKIAKVQLSKCGFEVVDFRKNCDCVIAVADNISLKGVELQLRKCLLQVAELRLRTQK